MSSSYRPNRYIAPSLRGERAIDAAEQQARAQILRDKAKAAAKKAAAQQTGRTNLGGEKSSLHAPLK